MSLELDTPVQFIKGVGPKVSSLLARKDIHNVGDVLQWFPRTYEDRRSAKSINQLMPGTLCSFVAQVQHYRMIPMGRTRRMIHEVLLRDDTGQITGKWFRVPFKSYFESFKPKTLVRVTGEVKEYRGSKEIHHPDIRVLDEAGDEVGEDKDAGLLPIYSETEGLNQKLIRKIVQTALSNVGSLVEETMPEWILRKYGLPPLKEALLKVHKPGEEDVKAWQEFQTPHQRRLIFEEFFWLELHLARTRHGMIKEKAPALRALTTLSQGIRKQLEFTLTEGQEKTLADITGDVIHPHPMHRLVQGDVGCGKTVVAFLAAAMVIENGFQVAIMAPTEILAEQHFTKAQSLFANLGINVAFLSGGQKEKDAKVVREGIENGKFQLVVGTHALIQEGVNFNNLGFVIIDEQHRFGVKQRAQLKQKGISPHFLIMTATPIPRTLAMTVYGDLDVSIIKEMPKGRLPITTKVTYESKRNLVYDFVRGQLERGRQAYVIYPLVEETEKLDLKNATDMAKTLSEEFKPHSVGLLHGRLKSIEKENLMHQFKAGELRVLVSTTVVEVGVDVPNASVMVIEHAERFGLSQLHQLRGRVGRGIHKSYCILLAGRAQSDEAKRRLEVMAQTQDGFKIAEEDLIIRGPGEFLGTRQSGLPGFRLANLVRDVETLTEARKAAFEILEKDPDLKSPDNKLIHEAVFSRKKSVLLFATIG
ncbi:MAG: ATP-dependent DNA helicase RecG [Oligoflexia bacterium]|nr:ATP-dependent DNA helicase RecG [Oligoflexia bacterium]